MELTMEDFITVVLASQRGALLANYAEAIEAELKNAVHLVEQLTDALEYSNAQAPASTEYEDANQEVAACARLSLEAEAKLLGAILAYVEAQHEHGGSSGFESLLPQ